MLDIIIIGNSGAARECHQLFVDCVWASSTIRFAMNFKGFLSHKNFVGRLGDLQPMQIGDTESWQPSANERYIIGIGKPELRRDVFIIMKEKGAQFLNLISPWSYVPGGFRMGEANIINSSCNFSGGTSIGDGNYFNGNVRLGHDVNIGNFNFFAPSTTALGGSVIGDGNLLAIGTTLLEHCRVGNWNHFHPGAIVYKGCRNYCRMAGNPALKI